MLWQCIFHSLKFSTTPLCVRVPQNFWMQLGRIAERVEINDLIYWPVTSPSRFMPWTVSVIWFFIFCKSFNLLGIHSGQKSSLLLICTRKIWIRDLERELHSFLFMLISLFSTFAHSRFNAFSRNVLVLTFRSTHKSGVLDIKTVYIFLLVR